MTTGRQHRRSRHAAEGRVDSISDVDDTEAVGADDARALLGRVLDGLRHLRAEFPNVTFAIWSDEDNRPAILARLEAEKHGGDEAALVVGLEDDRIVRLEPAEFVDRGGRGHEVIAPLRAALGDVVLHGDARPMVHGVRETLLAGLSSDDDQALARALGDGCDSRQTAQRGVIAPLQGIEGFCQQCAEDDPSHSRQGCEDLHVMLLLLPRLGLLGRDHSGGQQVELTMCILDLLIDEADARDERRNVSCGSFCGASGNLDGGSATRAITSATTSAATSTATATTAAGPVVRPSTRPAVTASAARPSGPVAMARADWRLAQPARGQVMGKLPAAQALGGLQQQRVTLMPSQDVLGRRLQPGQETGAHAQRSDSTRATSAATC